MGFLFLYIGKLFQLYRKFSCIFFNNFFPCIFLYLFLEFLPIKLWTPWCDHLIFTFSILLSTCLFLFLYGRFPRLFPTIENLFSVYFQSPSSLSLCLIPFLRAVWETRIKFYCLIFRISLSPSILLSIPQYCSCLVYRSLFPSDFV